MPFGKLDVYVEGAINIKDSSIIGRGSPYCTVTCGQQAFNTPVVAEGGNCPFFNASLQFNVDRTTTELQITILSKNKLRDDDILGYATLVFKEVFFHSHSVPLTDYPVVRPTGRTQGQIRLSLTFHAQPIPNGYVERPGPPPRVNNFRPGFPNQIPRQFSNPTANPEASNPLGRQTSQPGQAKPGYASGYSETQPQQYAPVQQPPYQQQAPAYSAAPFTPRQQGSVGGPPPSQRRSVTAVPVVKKSPKSSSSLSVSSDDEEDSPGRENHRGPIRNPQPTAAARNGSGQTRGPKPNPPFSQPLPRQNQQQYNGTLAPPPAYQRGAPQQQQYGALAPPPGYQRGAPYPPQQQSRSLAPPPAIQAQQLLLQQQFKQLGLQRQQRQSSLPLPPQHRLGATAPRQAGGGANDTNGGNNDGGAGNGDTSADGGADGAGGGADAGGADAGGADAGAGGGADAGCADTGGAGADGGYGAGDADGAYGADGVDVAYGAYGADVAYGANGAYGVDVAYGAGGADGVSGAGGAYGAGGADGSYGADYGVGGADGIYGGGGADGIYGGGADGVYGGGGDASYGGDASCYGYDNAAQGYGTADPSQAYDTSGAVGYDPGYYQQDCYQGGQDYGYQQQDNSYQDLGTDYC